MKRIFTHPPKQENGRQYWRSLDEHADTPEFKSWLEQEFPAGAAEMEMDGVSRRNFLQLMGASLALAGFGVAGCRRPESYTVPFTRGVEWSVPGNSLFYATSMPSRRGAVPLIATTHEGRPTKIEGNPLHPSSNGGTDAFAQASVLDLWDPDRAKGYVANGKVATAEDFLKYFSELLKAQDANRGSNLAFLYADDNSPTTDRLRARVAARFPLATWCVYEAMGHGSVDKAVAAGFGSGVRLREDFSKADVVLSLGADFLGAEDGTVEKIRDFSARRRVLSTQDAMNRLYVAENRFTVTGGMADHRLRARASELPALAVKIAFKVAALTGHRGLAQVAGTVGAEGDFDPKWVEGVAADLVAAKGKALVVAGSQQGAAVQSLALALNEALGSIGETLVTLPDESPNSVSIEELAAKIKVGDVNALIIAGGNPVFDAPAGLDWRGLQNSISDVVRLGLWGDETSEASKWHVPAAHYLESWGDGIASDGSYLPVQPMILPLYGGQSLNDLLALAAGDESPDGAALVRETFDNRVEAGDQNSAWTAFLRDGFAEGSAAAPVSVSFDADAVATLAATDDSKPVDGIEVVFATDSKVDDGRYVNNGWMQELPDPVTKLTWDNAAHISPATAKQLGIDWEYSDVNLKKRGSEVVKITVGTRSLEIPVIVAPGHADDSLTIPVGYGRMTVGRVGSGVGFNAYSIRESAGSIVAAAKVEKVGRKHLLAVTHGHWVMEGRGMVREATLDQFHADPGFAGKVGMDSHIPPDVSLYKSPPLTAEEQWGMSIDLNTCTGCNACVVACQSENNIPIVGKEQVINQREMHWMRIDRYFSSVDEHDPDPEMVMQPLNCQHCENAPCETVCPVNATVHSPDGMNAMVYNRCIGTRYCANNCPFKVRRFNFFDYNKRDVLSDSKIFPEAKMFPEGSVNFADGRSSLYDGPFGKKGSPETIKMQKNPNVTVRMRGVMEKCSFCVQRIEEARIKTRVEAGASDKVRIPADVFKTACQQVCPAEAIVFGDKANTQSDVAKLKELPTSYQILRYLNVRPRVSYLARLRNPNMAIPGADKVGQINHMGEDHGGGDDAAGTGGEAAAAQH